MLVFGRGRSYDPTTGCSLGIDYDNITDNIYYVLLAVHLLGEKKATVRGSRFTSAGSKGPDKRTWPNGDMGVDGVSDDEARSWCSTDAGAYCCWCCWNRRWNCWWINASASAVFRCLGLCRLLASDAPPAAAYMSLQPAHDVQECRRRRRRRRPGPLGPRRCCLCRRFPPRKRCHNPERIIPIVTLLSTMFIFQFQNNIKVIYAWSLTV